MGLDLKCTSQRHSSESQLYAESIKRGVKSPFYHSLFQTAKHHPSSSSSQPWPLELGISTSFSFKRVYPNLIPLVPKTTHIPLPTQAETITHHHEAGPTPIT